MLLIVSSVNVHGAGDGCGTQVEPNRAEEQEMTMEHVRWGIAGPGGIAHRFADQLAHSATGALVAVASRDQDRARSFAAEYSSNRHEILTALHTPEA